MSEQVTTFWTRRGPELRQTLRVTVAAAAAFVAYKLLNLQQGYWAIFTVLIVMQGSIGGTLGAATERMIGTFAGAILGGIAAAFHDDSSLKLGTALIVVTGLGVWGASLRPQLKVAPVTAAIMLLSAPPGVPVHTFVLDRIIEIALGGAIGVLATVFIFPARSRGVVITRSVAVLQRIQNLLLSEAGAIERGLDAARDDPPALANEARSPFQASWAVSKNPNRARRRHSGECRRRGLAFGRVN